ncbi:hypothetical protein HNR05_001068 [Leifsonia psychrotolerans]|uniref:Uncharacterized protein n=1 Tax=Glaciibacter psychrotolerans TaxID=670054 RepID=A0A7Z0EE68_9MICO|nr:hypothetical protein [Leifsonia psychrotolerans]
MKRAAEWFLYLHEVPIDRAHELIPAPARNLKSVIDETGEEPTETSYYGTGLSADEGLCSSSGWAGRV